jgi:hypothetical protein
MIDWKCVCVCVCVCVHYEKYSDLLLAFQLGFELQWPLTTLLQLNVFLQHELQ